MLKGFRVPAAVRDAHVARGSGGFPSWMEMVRAGKVLYCLEHCHM